MTKEEIKQYLDTMLRQLQSSNNDDNYNNKENAYPYFTKEIKDYIEFLEHSLSDYQKGVKILCDKLDLFIDDNDGLYLFYGKETKALNINEREFVKLAKLRSLIHGIQEIEALGCNKSDKAKGNTVRVRYIPPEDVYQRIMEEYEEYDKDD